MKPIRTYLRAVKALTKWVLLLASVVLAGCVKYTAECEVVVMPRRMIVESSPRDGAAYMVRIYVFYIGKGKIIETDIRDWRPMSYSDAEAGVVTNEKTGKKRYAGFYREQGDDSYVRLPLTSSPALLVAVNEMDGQYAWRSFEYDVPMPRIEIPLRFMLWKSTAETPLYSDQAGWVVGSAAYPETTP